MEIRDSLLLATTARGRRKSINFRSDHAGKAPPPYVIDDGNIIERVGRSQTGPNDDAAAHYTTLLY